MQTTPNGTRILSAAALLLSVVFALPAASIPISNAGFESLSLAHPDDYSLNNIPGWNVSLHGFASTFRPGGEFPAGIPDGLNVAAVGGGSSISQTLSGFLTGDTNYTLLVGVGNRRGYFYGYTITLSAGGVVLATDSVRASDYTAFAEAYGTFTTSTINYFAVAGNAQIGTALSITLSSPGDSSGQAEFDNVRLSSSGGTSGTPEPASFGLMLAAGACGALVRRKWASVSASGTDLPQTAPEVGRQ